MKRKAPTSRSQRSVNDIVRDPKLTEAEKLAEVTTALRELGDDPLVALAWRLSMFQWLGPTPSFERMVHILKCDGRALRHPKIQNEMIWTMGELRASSTITLVPTVVGRPPDKAPARKRMRQVMTALQYEVDAGANTVRVARAAEIQRWIAENVRDETDSVRQTLKAAVKRFRFRSVHALEQELHRARELQEERGETMSHAGFKFPRRKGRRL